MRCQEKEEPGEGGVHNRNKDAYERVVCMIDMVAATENSGPADFVSGMMKPLPLTIIDAALAQRKN